MTRPTSPRLFDAELFARCLAAYLAERKARQQDAAKAAGVSQGTLSCILSGERPPTLETFARLCRWMRVPIGLFFREGEGA
jgi:transcriptional regulator with XRE-family HTH domain